MLGLYQFEEDCYYGKLSGLFIANVEAVQQAIGKQVNFGEVLGKHSEIYFDLTSDNITMLEVTQTTISDLYSVSDGNDTISGYNPLNYIDNDEDDDEEED